MNYKILFIFSLLILTGCTRYVNVHDYYPVYQQPEKAQIATITIDQLSTLDEQTRDAIIETVKDLKRETAELRSIVERYNKYAKSRNEWTEYQLRAPWYKKMLGIDEPENPQD